MRGDAHHALDPADVLNHHWRQLGKKDAATTAVNSHASRTPRSYGPSAAHLQRPVIPPPRKVRERSSQDPGVDVRRDQPAASFTKLEPEPPTVQIHTDAATGYPEHGGRDLGEPEYRRRFGI